MHGILLTLILLLPSLASADQTQLEKDIAEIERMNCQTPAAVEAWFKNWRERKRLDVALQLAKQLPDIGKAPPAKAFIPPGSTCMKGPDNTFAEKTADANIFMIGCLMRVPARNEDVLHVFQAYVPVEYDQTCLSDANIKGFSTSDKCKKENSAEIKRFFIAIGGMPPPKGVARQAGDKTCGIGPPISMPDRVPLVVFQTRPTLVSIDPRDANKDVNGKVERLRAAGEVEVLQGKVVAKKDSSTAGGGLKNPLGDLPLGGEAPGSALDAR